MFGSIKPQRGKKSSRGPAISVRIVLAACLLAAFLSGCTTPLHETLLAGDATGTIDAHAEPPQDPGVEDDPVAEDLVIEGLVSCHAEIRVLDGSDDAGVNPHSCLFSTRDNEVYLGTCLDRSAPVTSGVRFEDIPVPPGGIVTRAFLRVTIDGPYDARVVVTIAGEDVAGSQDFVSGDDVAGRAKTDASMAWDIPASDRWTLGGTRETPDLSSVVQEIVDLPGWAAGNPLTVIFTGDVAGTDPNKHRRFIAVERREYAPALLVLDYLAPSCDP